MLAKAVFAQTHRHLYFFDLPGRQNSKQYPRSANKSTEKTGILLGLTFCGLYALKQRQSGSSVGCRSPPYQSFLKPTKNDWTEAHNLEKTTQSGLYHRKRRVHGIDLWGILSPWANLPVICGQAVPASLRQAYGGIQRGLRRILPSKASTEISGRTLCGQRRLLL